MKPLATKLIETPVREDSATADRYHYQAMSGLALIFERYNTGCDDFALVFEFHDDIAILDSADAPNKVSFYQIKSKKSGHWTRNALIKQKKSIAKKNKGMLLPSPLGKLYQNVVEFEDEVEKACFVSNAPFKFLDDEGEVLLSKCANEDLDAIIAALESECVGAASIRTDLVQFSQTDLSLSDTDTHAKGKLLSFVTDHLGEMEFSLEALFKAVSHECTSKSRSKVIPTSLNHAIEKKGITKADVDGWLNSVQQVVACPSWEEISPDLPLPPLQKASIRDAWRRYRIQVLNPNEAVRTVRRKISDVLTEECCSEMSMPDLIEYVFGKVEASAHSRLSPVSNETIKAMIIYETYTGTQTGELQDSSSQPQDQTT